MASIKLLENQRLNTELYWDLRRRAEDLDIAKRAQEYMKHRRGKESPEFVAQKWSMNSQNIVPNAER